MDQKKALKLQAFLSSLPDKIARQLALAVEYDRIDQGVLPHDLIMAALRPALRRTGLSRGGVATAERCLFEPVEDLLTSRAEPAKRAGIIARSSLDPVWRWLSMTLIPAETKQYVGKIVSATKRDDPEDRQLAVEALTEACADAIDAALRGVEPGRGKYDSYVKALGGPMIVEDAREIGMLLRAAPAFREVQQAIPRGVKRVGNDELTLLRRVYDELMERFPDQAAYVPVIAMRRIGRPAQVMDILKNLARTEDDARIVDTTLGMAGNLLLCDLEEHAAYLRSVHLGDGNASEALGKLEWFAETSSGLTQYLDIRREGPWGQRLVASRNIVSDAMDRLCEKIPDQIAAAFPLRQVGNVGGRGIQRPNLDRWPDDAKIVVAANIGLFLAGAKWHAGKAAFGVSHRNALDKVTKFLVAYAEHLVFEFKTAEEDMLARCEAHLEALHKVTEVVLGEQEASLLRRRVAMAKASGTAAA